MPKRTDLAGGTINGNAQLVIQLIEPPDSPPVVAISWPSASGSSPFPGAGVPDTLCSNGRRPSGSSTICAHQIQIAVEITDGEVGHQR